MKRLFVLIGLLFFYMASTVVAGNNKSDVPDFNYPKKVISNAERNLSAAIKSGDGKASLKYLVQSTLAKSIIATDEVQPLTERIDSIAQVQSDSAIKSMLHYFNACVLHQYYSQNKWTIKRRKALAGATDMKEWNDQQFESAILSLLDKALKNKAALLNTKIDAYGDIIKYDENSHIFYPTMYDMLCWNAIDIINSFDESKATKTLKSSIYASIKEAHASDYGPLLKAMVASVKSDDFKSLRSIYDKYISLTDMAYLAINGFEEQTEAKRYEINAKFLEKYPNSIFVPNAELALKQLECKQLNISINDSFTTADSIKIECFNNNANDYTAYVFRIPDNANDIYAYKGNFKEMQCVAKIPMYCAGTVPFCDTTTITTKPLTYGRYFVFCDINPKSTKSIDKKLKDISRYELCQFTVSDIMLFSATTEPNTCHIFAVNTISGRPMKNVVISVKDGATMRTNSDGYVIIKKNDKKSSNYTNVTASNGNDRYTEFRARFFHTSKYNNRLCAKIFTDLAIYHPGDTVKFSALCYHLSEKMGVAPNAKINIEFRDKNYELIDTISAITDDMGRFSSQFIVPRDRMNGMFCISVIANSNTDKEVNLCSHDINVSDYKTPTFYVETDGSKKVYDPSKPVVITGKAVTYVDVPVANADIVAELSSKEVSWFRSFDNKTHMHTFHAKTAADGTFAITIPCDSLIIDNPNVDDDDIAFGSFYGYELGIDVTSSAGETQSAAKTFYLKKICTINSTENDFTFNADCDIKLPLKISNTDDDKKIACRYSIVDKASGSIVATGSFTSDSTTISLRDVKSGKYRLIVSAPDASDFKSSIVLFHSADKKPPVDSPLWIPKCNSSIDGNNNVTIKLGTSYADGYVYCVARSRNKIISDGWQRLNQGFNTLKYSIPKDENEFIDIKFITARDGILYSENLHLNSQYKQNCITIKPTAFRDNLVPGTPERWTFHLTTAKGQLAQGAMLCEMYDKALDKLAGNHWNFKPKPIFNELTDFLMPRQDIPTSAFYILASSRKCRSAINIPLPNINLYYMKLFYGARRLYKYSNAMYRSAEAPMGDVLYESGTDNRNVVEEADMSLQESVVVSSAKAGAGNDAGNSALDKVALRTADIQTALWRPNLRTDDHGDIFVDFYAPQFNTTWVMQAFAYTSDLRTAKFVKDVITKKPIMVRANLPRFVRQGDKVSLASSLINATDSTQQCNAIIELFIPETGKIIASKNFEATLAPKATQALSIDWCATDTIASIGYRVKAANGNFGDGEQSAVVVLPSISPIIETKPFFVDAASSRFSLNLPKFPKGSRVTLEYCENPVWYCITALPTVKADNYMTSSALAHSLYAVVLAEGIAKSNPDIKEAIDFWVKNESDSSLVSNLEKNSELKIGTLLASPWLQEARRQTLRMQSISSLFDTAKNAAETEKIIKKLQELQMKDGGWTWFKYRNCQSSLYVTSEVLELIGELRHLGYLTDNAQINAMLKKALAYYDNCTLKDFKERKNKHDYSGLSDYVYIRSLFSDFAMPAEMKKLHTNALKTMKTEWKGLSILSKAYFAVALHRNNDTATAKDIIESIRQFSITTPDSGMYWDNLQMGWDRFFSKTAITSTILQAFAEIEPDCADIDQIRKWVLLDKQANDWGSSSLASDAIYALLSSGSKWLGKQNPAEINIGGTRIDNSKADQYLGYFKRTLNVETAAESAMTISRHGTSPAWGAVYCQYSAPMTTVKAASVGELSIEKETYVVDGDRLVKTSKMKVGDRVQVRFVIRNTRDLEYVTLNDERAACTEPVDQISEYKYLDGTGFYQEIKDDATRIFFNYLPKGTHVITYDLHITAPGEYNVGIATIQCQYAPQIAAHSKGNTIKTIK